MKLALSNQRMMIIAIIILYSQVSLSAHEMTYSNSVVGSDISVSSSVEVKDDWYDYMQGNTDWINYANDVWPFSNPNSLRFVNKSSNGWVGLHWEGTDNVFYSSSWQVRVTLNVQGWSSDGSYLGTSTEMLEIDYVAGNKVEYEDWSSVSIADAHRITMSITGIEVFENGSWVLYNSLPSLYGDIILEGRVMVERYFWLPSDRTTANLDYQAGDGVVGQTWDGTKERTVDIYWDNIEGAEEYDLELLFVSDQFNTDPENGGTDPSPLLNDWSSATRITLSDLHYKIEMVYETGTLYYRVRGVGRHGDNMLDRREADWLIGTNTIVVDGPKAYTPEKNWAYSVSYAEEGKRSEVVSFVDGIGRGRQSVTKTTTRETVMLSESHYDYEGRASLSVMPSAVLGSKSLGFHKYYSLNDNQVALAPKDWDNDGAYIDGGAIKELSSSYSGTIPSGDLSAEGGSARYYSSANPNAGSGVEAYVPDAGGYPCGTI